MAKPKENEHRRCLNCKEPVVWTGAEFLFCSSDCEEQWAYYQQGFVEKPERPYELKGSDGERPMKGDDV